MQRVRAQTVVVGEARGNDEWTNTTDGDPQTIAPAPLALGWSGQALQWKRLRLWRAWRWLFSLGLGLSHRSASVENSPLGLGARPAAIACQGWNAPADRTARFVAGNGERIVPLV